MSCFNLFKFLAVLGGNMGLFLGASFLTVVQLGEYFIDEMIGWCVCTGQRKDEKQDGGYSNKVDPEKAASPAKNAWTTEEDAL